MTAERWQLIKEVFHATLDQPRSQYESYLHQACGSDDELRTEIEELLAAHEGVSGFLEQWPSFTLEGPEKSDEQPVFTVGETLLGRFEVRGFLGRGGMGEVYSVWDRDLKQQCALKTLRAQFIKDPSTVEQFKREVQIALGITHPNVCRVHGLYRCESDYGDVPFYTMELLQGETLTEQLKRRKRFTIDEALPVIQQIGSGLEALHECGVVHRDLKPDNVMIIPEANGEYRVVVADLGIAKSVTTVGSEPSTGPNIVVGTPAYMAPEHYSRGSVGPAADVYSLGIVIHEMLTGVTPNEDGIRLGESIPGANAVWDRTIRACLSLDPGQRPANIRAVLANLAGQRDANEATEGRARSSLRYGASQGALTWEPGSRAWGFLATLTALVLIAVLWLIGGTSRSRSASPPEQQVLAVLPLTNIGGETGRQAFCDGLAQVVTSGLTQARMSAESLAVIPFSEVLRRGATTASDAAARFDATMVIQGSLQGSQDQLLLTLDLIDAGGLTQIGSAVVEGSADSALELQHRAVRAVLKLLEPHLAVSGTLQTEGAPAEGSVNYEEYLRGRGYLARYDRPADVAKAIDIFTDLVKASPQDALGHAGLAEAYLQRYRHERDRELLHLAEASANRAAELDASLPEVDQILGMVYVSSDRPYQAIALFNQVLTTRPRSGEAYRGLGQAYTSLGRFKAAEKAFVTAVQMEPKYWVNYNRLQYFYYGRGRYREAIKSLREVVRLTPDNAAAYNSLGSLLHLTAAFEEAEQMFLRSIEIGRQQASGDPNACGYGIALSNLGEIYLEERNYDAAEDYLRESVECDGNWHTPWGILGEVILARKGQEAARPYFQKAIELATQALDDNPHGPATIAYLAGFHARLGDRQTAAEEVERALSFQTKDPRLLARCGEVLGMLGDTEAALDLLRKAIDGGFLLDVLKRRPGLRHLGPDDWRRLTTVSD